MLIIVFFCGTCFIFSLIIGRGSFTGDVVAVIDVEGIITSSGGGDGMFGWGCSAESLVEQLHRARKDDRIKAILLRIDSPGGTPAAAEEVYTEIRRTVKEKPVVVSIGDMGASAAYFIAAATDVIFASPDSDVGSIGVIVQIPNVEELNRKIGVEYTIITEGEYKDIGSPYRPVTPQEHAIIEGQMRVAYNNLIKGIAEGRGMEEARVREIATGLTWPGVEARDMGLIDELGNFRDAIEEAGRMGGIEGDVHIIYMSRGSSFSLFSELISAMKEIANSLGRCYCFVRGIMIRMSSRIPVKLHKLADGMLSIK
jgi:protease-4